MRRTAVRAALQRAVLAVPAGDAQASAVLALPVFIAPVVAQLRIAVLAGPAGVTAACVAHAMAVRAAVQIAQFCGTDKKRKTDVSRARAGVTVTRWKRQVSHKSFAPKRPRPHRALRAIQAGKVARSQNPAKGIRAKAL